MASRRSSGKRARPYDLTNPTNLTMTQLREAVHKQTGVILPSSLNKTQLKQMYVDNISKNTANTRTTASLVEEESGLQPNYISSAEASTPSTITAQTTASVPADGSTSRPVIGLDLDSNMAAPMSVTTTATSDNLASSQLLFAMQQTIGGLQQTVSNLMTTSSANTCSGRDTDPTFTLDQVYKQRTAQAAVGVNTPSAGPSMPGCHSTLTAGLMNAPCNPIPSSSFTASNTGTFGTPMESLPHMDMVSPSLRKAIIQGRDVNLATLLVQYYDHPDTSAHAHCHHHEGHQQKDDPNLKKVLRIGQFYTAFGRYQRIMCQAYPDRREELDLYLATINSIYNAFGEKKAYEYHKLFSLRSANALHHFGIKVDWSVKDKELLQLVSAGAKATYCSLCGEVSHDTEFCHLQTRAEGSKRSNDYRSNEYRSNEYRSNSSNTNRGQFRTSTDADKYGRRRVLIDGTEICNNYNSTKGCTRATCQYVHACLKCQANTHCQLKCDKQSAAAPPKGNPTSPQK
jgi:hypothetical protein